MKRVFFTTLLDFSQDQIIKRLSCRSCKSLFTKLTDTTKIELDKDLGENRIKLMEQINRGWLCTPSDAMYICVLYARQLYKKIFDKWPTRFQNLPEIFLFSIFL